MPISAAALDGSIAPATIDGRIDAATFASGMSTTRIAASLSTAQIGATIGGASLAGSIALATSYPTYAGETLVIPRADESVELQTGGKVVMENITVTKVPYWETSNQSGMTAYIASEA